MPAISYNYRADECPAIVVPSALLSPNADPPAPTTWNSIIQGVINDLSTRWNRNATRGDLTGRWGGGGYARTFQLDMSDGGGLTGSIALGQAMIDGPVTKDAVSSIALTDDIRGFQWLTQAAALPVVNYPNLSPPTTRCTYLGSWLTVGSVITEIDYSGVLFLRGGTLWRRTADAGVPTDAPPANLQFYQRSLNGLYWWDGYEYWPVAADTLIRLAAQKLTVPSFSVNYRYELDFSAAGTFADECLTICAVSDEAGPIISVETNRQTAGRVSLIVYVPLDSMPGTYGGALNLELNVAVKGLSWSGAQTVSVPVAISDPDPVAP